MNENNIRKYLSEFRSIQEEQISSFNIDGDLDSLIFARKRAFENLRVVLSSAPSSEIQKFRKEAEELSKSDRQFLSELEEQKKALKAKIIKCAKGKQILKGYNSSSSRSLRFVNTRG